MRQAQSFVWVILVPGRGDAWRARGAGVKGVAEQAKRGAIAMSRRHQSNLWFSRRRGDEPSVASERECRIQV